MGGSMRGWPRWRLPSGNLAGGRIPPAKGRHGGVGGGGALWWMGLVDSCQGFDVK